MAFFETVRSKLPVFNYTIKKTIKKKLDPQMIFSALQERLDGCEATLQPDGSLELRNIDPQWLARGYRDVVMTVRLKTQMDNTTIVAEVRQGWSHSFAVICVIAVPLLVVGVLIVALASVFCFMAKGKITQRVQKALDDIADELG